MKTRQVARSIVGAVVETLLFLIQRLFVVVLWAVGFFYVVFLFVNLSKDTTPITNGAFAILATLAALSFSFARAVGPSHVDADRILYAGERLLHGSLILLGASILKYAALAAGKEKLLPSNAASRVHVTIGVIVGLLFLWSLDFAHTGMTILNKLLWSRLHRYPDWKSVA